MAKESLCCLIVLPSVLPPGGRIKDFSVQWIVGNDSGSAGHDHTPPPGWTSIPIPEHRGQQIRRLAFGQPRPSGQPELAQQRRLFLRGRLLPPGCFRLHQPRYPQMPRIVFRQPLGVR